MIEPVLYMDLQAAKPGKFCEVCGGECYAPTFTCLRCERRLGYDAGRAEPVL